MSTYVWDPSTGKSRTANLNEAVKWDGKQWVASPTGGTHTLTKTGAQAISQPAAPSAATKPATTSAPAATAPKGQIGIRSFFEGQGQEVSWEPGKDGQPGTVVAGGLRIGPDSYKNVGGTTYMDPTALGGMILGQKPKSATPENLAPFVQSATNMLNPMYDARKSALQVALEGIESQAAQGVRNVESGYETAIGNLGRATETARTRDRSSAISRGTYDSGTYDVAIDKTSAESVNAQKELEKAKGTSLENIESQKAQLLAGNAQAEKELEAGFMTDVNARAMDLFGNEQNQSMARNSTLAQYLFGIADKNYQKERDTAEDALKQKSFDYQVGRDKVDDERWAKEFGLKQFDANTSRINANKSGGAGSDGSAGTAGERKQLATATFFDTGTKRYDELKKDGYKYPLYYAINSMMRDPEWIKLATTTGVDIRSAVDNLIVSKSKMSPEAYFKTPTGKKLSAFYYALFPQKQTQARQKDSSWPAEG